MSYNTLVSATDLAAHLDDPHWVVCDCRHDLADYEAGRRAYAQSHIPGARFLHLDEDLSAAARARAASGRMSATPRTCRMGNVEAALR